MIDAVRANAAAATIAGGPQLDPLVPSDFSRESIMFVRYAVDCCGERVFDLPAEAVSRLWLDFCVEFNRMRDGTGLTEDWYRCTAVPEAGGARRLVRLDATTWPVLDRCTAFDWGTRLTPEQQQQGREAADASSKIAQSHFRTFFSASRPARTRDAH